MLRLSADLLVDAHAEVGEGPVWDERSGSLWWVDILGGSVHRTDVSTGADETIAVGQPIGAVGLRESGGLVAAVRDGFAVLDPEYGTCELRAPVEADDRMTRMNDGKPDPAGRFWAGTMELDGRADAGTLYRLDVDWTVSPVLRGTSISNGLDWSADGRTMYYIDTSTRRVDRFTFDAPRGRLGRRTTAVSIPAEMGWPDGLTLDAEGGVWVALWDGGGVARFTPQGRLDRFVGVPVQQATCPAFGGPGLDLLFITTAREGFGPEGPPGEPHAGGVFVCRPGVVGRAANRFRG